MFHEMKIKGSRNFIWAQNSGDNCLVWKKFC